MAVTHAKEQDGCYIGSIGTEDIKAIKVVRECSNIEHLKGTIFSFPTELVERSIESKQSIRGLIKDGTIDVEEIGNIYGVLKAKQTVATAFLYYSRRSILGDAVGSGKTVVASSLINYLKSKGELSRFIFFADTGTSAIQCQKELIKFTGLNIVNLPSQKAPMEKFIRQTEWSEVDGIVTTHSALTSDTLLKWLTDTIDTETSKITMFNTMFLDESSVIKNESTKIYRYTQTIVDKTERVHFLNATAFETNIIDIYNQVNLLRNELLPKRYRIEKAYCNYVKEYYWITQNNRPTQKFTWKISSYKNTDDFKVKLQLVYFGRSKTELNLKVDHRYKVYSTYPTLQQTFEIKQGSLYNKVLNCPTLLDNTEIKFNRDEVPKLRLLTDLVTNEYKDKSVMVYCFYIDAMTRIKEELEGLGKSVGIIDGATPIEERDRLKGLFNSKQLDVLITNVNRSLNLYGGDVCIWYTYSGNPAKMEQIRGRIDRNIDNNEKEFVLLLYKNTQEYGFFTEIAGKRAFDSRKLTIDTDTCVDYFMQVIIDGEDVLKCY